MCEDFIMIRCSQKGGILAKFRISHVESCLADLNLQWDNAVTNTEQSVSQMFTAVLHSCVLV